MIVLFRPSEAPLPRIRGYQDLSAGLSLTLGSVTFGRDDIVEFAETFDPQPFHLDEAAARDSMFGELVASGFQTISAVYAISVRAGILAEANLGGAGMEGVRWLRPVKPGDVLTLVWTVEAVAPSLSRSDRANVRIRYEGVNQDGKPVVTMTIGHIVRRA